MTTATITMRSYAGEGDLQLIADLINACEAVDRVEDGTSVEELRSEFTSPRFDLARNLRLWEDAEGRLAGYAEMWFNDTAADPDGLLWFKVQPDARGGDLDAQIIAWGTGRVREAECELGKRLRLRSVTREILAERIATLERHGFMPDRYFLRMVRPLGEPIPEPALPEGFTVISGNHDPETWVALYNESFVDHWNFSPMTVEDYRHYLEEPHHNPELHLVALAPDGKPAGFAWCSISQEENARSGRNEGWIGLLGSRRGFRKIGLGRAMLLTGMGALRGAGAEIAKLGVDGASLTGATRLYESVGFNTVATRILYGKEI